MRSSSSKDQQRLYSDLAWTWPIISAPENYIREANEFWWTIRAYSRLEAKSLLDLGCGGGHYDFTWKKYFQVTGVDNSEPMLSLARQLNPEVSYCPGDMRTVRLGQTFDAVVIADSINCMLTEDDLLAAFTTAFEHLNPGGVFCTYAEDTPERFLQNRTKFSTHIHDETTLTFIENAYDPDPQDTTYENTFIFLIRRGKQQQIETDRHLGGLFPVKTWIRLLQETGFEVTQKAFTGEGFPMFACLKPS